MIVHRRPPPFSEAEGDEQFHGRLACAISVARERARARGCRQRLRIMHDPVTGLTWQRFWILQDVR